MISDKDELKSRVEARRAEMETRLKSLKADTQAASRDEVEKIERNLDSLKDTLKDGWRDLNDAAMRRLNDFLDVR